MGADRFGGGDHILLTGILIQVADVLVNRPGEQVGLLENHTHLVHHGPALNVLDVVAVHGYTPLGDIGEPVNQSHQSALASAGGPHQRHVLSGADVEIYVLENVDARNIVEADVFELDLAFNGWHVDSIRVVLHFRHKINYFENAHPGGHTPL